jgi:hypothetical protein
MKHFNNTLLVGVLVVVLIVVVILHFVNIQKKSHTPLVYNLETYIDNQASLPWTIYNKKFMRQIEFAPPHVPISASFRALPSDEQLSNVNAGQCLSLNKPAFANDKGLSIVKEQELVYSLRHECLTLPYVRPSTPNNFSIKFRGRNDWNTYVYLILLNPLYVEMSTHSSPASTIAYFLKKPDGFTMNNKGIGPFNAPTFDLKTVNLTTVDFLKTTCKQFMSSPSASSFNANIPAFPEIPLIAVHEANEQSTNPNDIDDYTLFTYPNYNKRTYTQLSIQDKDVLQIRAYYLDDIKPSTQALIRSLNYSQNPTGAYKVFLSNFDNTTDTQIINAYPYTYNIGANLFRELCKYIYRCHSNSIYFPVFTLSFDLAINKRTFSQSFNKNTRYQILEMCMKNGIGAQTFSCVNNVDYSKTAFVKNANIISCALTIASDDTCSLELTTSRNGCTYTYANVGDILKVSLPMVDTSATAKTIVTVTPYKIHVFVSWHKPLEGMQWVYSEKEIAPGNDFETLFTKKKLSNNTLADIDITVVPQIINQVNEVKLGYKNFALEFKNNT